MSALYSSIRVFSQYFFCAVGASVLLEFLKTENFFVWIALFLWFWITLAGFKKLIGLLHLIAVNSLGIKIALFKQVSRGDDSEFTDLVAAEEYTGRRLHILNPLFKPDSVHNQFREIRIKLDPDLYHKFEEELEKAQKDAI